MGEEFVAEGAVEAGEGLVEQKEAGVGHGESAGQADALALAAAELVRAFAQQGM